MKLIGMPDAGEQLGVSGDSAKRALAQAGVPLVRINARAWAVEEADLKVFIEQRGVRTERRGRPAGAKNKPKSEAGEQAA